MGLIRRAVNALRGKRLARDIDRELAFHLAEREDELVRQGMERSVARLEARRRFGNPPLQFERTRDRDLLPWVDAFARDVRSAGRSLKANPGFALVSVGLLALGIGANTAIFSLIDAVMLRSLPVRHPEELVQVGSYHSNPLWEAIRDHQEVFEHALAYGTDRFNLAQSGEERSVPGSWVSGDFFGTLGVPAALGRTLAARDDRRGCPLVAVVSGRFWREELGADPGAVGRSISFDGHSAEIVGVVDPRFAGLQIGERSDVYLPLCAAAALGRGLEFLSSPSMLFLRLLGRPKPGLSLARVNAGLASTSQVAFQTTVPPRWGVQQQQEYRRRTLRGTASLAALSSVRQSYSETLLVLLGVVALVLLIACANVANLMLARSAARRRELAVRVALGAGRGRLVSQLFIESLLLAVTGALLGLILAVVASRGLVRFLSTSEQVVALDLTLDWRVLGFALAMAVGTALVFGLVPAWRAGRVDPQDALRSGGRGTVDGQPRAALGIGLVVAQIAISLVLVTGAGLLLGSFRALVSVDPGFTADQVLLVTADLRLAGTETAQAADTYRRALERLASIPGVVTASAAFTTPISGSIWNGDIVPDLGGAAGPAGEAYFNEVTGGYFATLRTAIVAGRDFDARDVRGSTRVAIVNETLAKRFYRGRSPIGATFRMQLGDRVGDPYEVIGVVRDARYESLQREAPPTAYLSMTQDSAAGTRAGVFRPTFVLRSTLGRLELGRAVTAVFADVAPRATLQLTSFERRVAASLTIPRVLAILAGFFGALALLLAMIGLYGTISYNVTRRRNEIGVRLALGASQWQVKAAVLQEVGGMVGGGLLLGTAASLAASRLLANLLFGVKPHDPIILVGAATILAIVSLVAGFVPARRAAGLDPVLALRED